MNATRARLDVGDPMRALAALGVVWLHVVGSTAQQTGQLPAVHASPDYFAALWGSVGHLFNGLFAAVDIFFVLSAYLLSRPFLRSYIADEPLPSVPGYLRNRALRVLPVFWVVLLIVAVVGPRESWSELLALAAFLGSFKVSGVNPVLGQAWSLAVEVRFYLLLPFAALGLVALKRALGRRLPRWARIVLVLALVAGGFAASQDYAANHSPLSDSFFAHARFFAPGVVLAVLEHVLGDRLRERAWVAAIAPLVFACGAALVLLSFYVRSRIPGSLVPYVVPFATGAVLAGPLLWQWSGRAAWRGLDNAPLRWIGRRPYPLFLVHQLVIFKLAPSLSTSGWNVTLLALGPAALAVSLLAADLLHRLVERPALRHREPYAQGAAASEGERRSGGSVPTSRRAPPVPAPSPAPTSAS